jgi:uncharacterized protein (DUF2267 family)
MDEQELTLLVKTRAGLRTTKEAKRALGAALGALGCALDDQDARAVSKELPPRFAKMLARSTANVVGSVEALYAEADRRERVGLGFAMEHTQVVLQVLAKQLDPEVVARLRSRLPSDIASLLRDRSPFSEPPPYVHAHAERGPAPVQTLSRARPGTAEPIAETGHELAHAGSVARARAPHMEAMVETARSTRPGREDDTLATTRGGARRK